MSSRQVVVIPEGDAIIGFEINHGWLIDRVVFITRKGLRLGPLGTSDGGNISIGDFTNYSESDVVPVSLHGISYSKILSKGQLLWNNVIFHFAIADKSLVKMLNRGWGDDIYTMLRNKNILL